MVLNSYTSVNFRPQRQSERAQLHTHTAHYTMHTTLPQTKRLLLALVCKLCAFHEHLTSTRELNGSMCGRSVWGGWQCWALHVINKAYVFELSVQFLSPISAWLCNREITHPVFWLERNNMSEVSIVFHLNGCEGLCTMCHST